MLHRGWHCNITTKKQLCRSILTGTVIVARSPKNNQIHHIEHFWNDSCDWDLAGVVEKLEALIGK
jgi:hypothetical protein